MIYRRNTTMKMKLDIYVLVFVAALALLPFVVAWLWNWSVPIVFPRLVRDGYINANLDWFGGLAVGLVAGLLFKSGSGVKAS